MRAARQREIFSRGEFAGVSRTARATECSYPPGRCKPANGGQRLTPAVTGWLLATANLQAVSPTQLRPDEQLGRPWLGWAIVVLLFIVLVIGVVLWFATANPQFGYGK
jgi:hypothetical protein